MPSQDMTAWQCECLGPMLISAASINATLMQGDLLLPHCGIQAGMRGRLRRQVNYVVHCAASIIFNEHVHTLLANNYQVQPSLYLSVLLVCS